MMKKTIFSVLLACVIIMSVFSITVFAAPSNMKIGFTIIPTKIVSDESDVELRCGISNIAPEKEVTVEFLVDGTVKKTVSEKANSKRYVLSKYWWDTKGKKGCHVLGIKVKAGGQVLDEKYHMIQVLDLPTAGPKMATIVWEEPLAYKDGIYKAKRAIKKQDVVNNIEDMHNLGIDSIIFMYPEYIQLNTGAFYDSDLPELNQVPFPNPIPKFDLLDTVLMACEERGMNVFVGTGRGRDLFVPTRSNTDFDAAVNLAVKVMNEIYDKYGHYKSFYGWYMSHEPSGLFSTGNGDLVFYNEVLGRVRYRFPDKAVIVGPSGTPTMKEADMRDCEIDIFAFQDAVGPGYVPGKYTWNPENRIAMLNDIYSEYKKVADKIGKHLWSDFEIWQMDGPDYANPYPAKWSRVERQLDIEKKYVSCNSMYAYTGFMSSPQSTVQIGGPKAVELYKEYKAFVDAYMKEYGIVNHTIVTKKIQLTMKSLEHLSDHLPKKIEVETSHCGKKILVDVEWKKPEVTGNKASVKGVIRTEGFPVTEISAVITQKDSVPKHPTDRPTSQESPSETSSNSDPAANIESIPEPSVSETPADDSASVAADESAVSDEKSKVTVAVAEGKAGFPVWSVVLIAVIVVGGIGAAVYFLVKSKNKNNHIEEEK